MLLSISDHIVMNSFSVIVPFVWWLKNVFLYFLNLSTESSSTLDRMQQFRRIVAARVISMSFSWIAFAVYLQWQWRIHPDAFSTKSVFHCSVYIGQVLLLKQLLALVQQLVLRKHRWNNVWRIRLLFKKSSNDPNVLLSLLIKFWNAGITTSINADITTKKRLLSSLSITVSVNK